MSRSEIPCLSLAIARLSSSELAHYAVWVLRAPHPGGYIHQDRIWPTTLTEVWQVWQEFFSVRRVWNQADLPGNNLPQVSLDSILDALETSNSDQQSGYGTRLMQLLGLKLWEWLFEGQIQSSLSESQGIAIGKYQPLRLRLDIRDPDLILLPWEIMQQPGKQAISLNQQLLFSRTTGDVAPLIPRRFDPGLRILLVLGQDIEEQAANLKLEQEAQALAGILEQAGQTKYKDRRIIAPIPCKVDVLLQPSPSELTACLERETYNVFFYAGHGVPAPDGGLLFLRPDTPPLSGTELAQVLTRRQVTLAVFNACWGAESAYEGSSRAIPRSSLAEVLLHHGVPAVLGMRDSIADREALSFIEAFAQALAERMPIDEAVAVARQQLLTLYKFNQPAWTLPVLYMHPEFNGHLLKPLVEGLTELPELSSTWLEYKPPGAAIRVIGANGSKAWPIRGGLMRVGRRRENDLVIEESWVSQRHAEIICRDSLQSGELCPTYYLRDFSRYGTLVWEHQAWQRIHHREIALKPGTRLKFGSSHGQELEFILEDPESSL